MRVQSAGQHHFYPRSMVSSAWTFRLVDLPGIRIYTAELGYVLPAQYPRVSHPRSCHRNSRHWFRCAMLVMPSPQHPTALCCCHVSRYIHLISGVSSTRPLVHRPCVCIWRLRHLPISTSVFGGCCRLPSFSSIQSIRVIQISSSYFALKGIGLAVGPPREHSMTSSATSFVWLKELE